MSMDLEDQYDKIYRYCYFKVRHRETAEDITQETFLRFFESGHYQNRGQALHYLYRIAGNLCIDEYRRQEKTPLSLDTATIKYEDSGFPSPDTENNIIERIWIQTALSSLKESDRELLLLRYANDVPVSVMAKLFGISRFALYRRLLKAERALKEKLRKEDSHE